MTPGARLVSMAIMTGFMFYGIFRFIMDYLGTPIRIAADYIDSIGISFWFCLALAAVVVAIMRGGRKG